MKRAPFFSSASGNGRAQNKRPGAGRWRRQKEPRAGKLQKMGQAVREFVEAAAGPEGSFPSLSGTPTQGLPAVNRRRNRREVRREKRKLKRRHRRRVLNGKEATKAPPGPPHSASAAAAGKKKPQSPPPPEEKAAKEKRPPQGPEEKKKEPKLLPRARPSTAPSAPSVARKRALLAANEAEEREIRRLERQLGLRKRRRKAGLGGGEKEDDDDDDKAAFVPPSFTRDGLGYVLGALGSGATFCGLDESSEEEEGEEEEEEGAGGEPGEGLILTDEGGDTDGQEDDDEEGLLEEEEEEDSSLGEEEEDESGVEGEGGSQEEEASHSSRSSEDEAQSQELPSQSGAKYVPPPMRRPEEMLDAKRREELERLKKTVKGLVNRLSEPNLASISGQLEELYMAHSRKDMNETLTNTVISACVTSSAMPSRLVMEHVLLIGVLYQTVGIEVGAHFLETVVRKFDEVYKSETEGKECENLLTLIAHLYNFHVVHSLLIFDILKKLVSTFSEKDIELILLLLKNVGFSLRKDDALALKELITEVQKKANAVGKQFQDQSRVYFMLEIMLALKNNDMRKIPGYDPEPAEKLRKLLRTLVHGGNSGKEAQLRVSLESLLSADQVGRWWIVGSSWSGAPMIDSTSNKIQQILPAGKVSSKILELARKQRMNTDIRRNIFCILMTSEDFLDAFEKLLKLRLKDQQEREIVHVLIDCCLQEKTYNPFYAYLSAKFCEYERRFQMTFQFTMWDKIKDLGNLSAAASSNLVHLLAHLLKTKSLSLTVFKIIEFSELDKPKAHFLRQVLSVLLLQTDPEELNHIFGKLADNPKLGMLHEGLKLFLTHFLLKNIQALKNVEKATLLKEKIELVTRALKAKESRLKL